MLRTRLIVGSTAGLVLSAVFATLLTAIGVGETFFEPLRVVPNQPAPITLRLPPITDESASGIRTDTYIVPRGERVGRRQFVGKLAQWYEESRRPPRTGMLVGLWFVHFLIAMMMTTYMRAFSSNRGALLRTQVGVLGLCLLLFLFSKLFLLFTDLPPFVIPVAAIPLWASLYMDRRAAVMVSLALGFMVASLAQFSLTAVAVFVATGVSATLGFRDRKHSTAMVIAGLIAGVAGAAVVVAANMLFEGGFDLTADLGRGFHSDTITSFIGGAGAGVLAFALEGAAVMAIGAVSRRKLLDLTDLEQPLLQRMAREAPGSWEHSRAMANLAEAAAAAIHADSLLTRVGAYYHDLGKSVQPKYFVENLDPGEPSPHEDLEPDVSADAIMAHVVEGAKILRQGGVPEPVVEFCYTHHGTSVIEYFWNKCVQQGNPKGLKEAFFRYPGMRPRTKETAILMLIDSMEAASRTIESPDRQKLEEMVSRIIFVKLKQGQLDESGLTLEDLRVMSTRIVDTLIGMRHHRIRYQWQDQKQGDKPLETPGAATEEDVAAARREIEMTRSSEIELEKIHQELAKDRTPEKDR